MVTLKEYTNLRDNFGNFKANSDLKTYNEVLKLISQPEVKDIFGMWDNLIWKSYPIFILINQHSGESH